MEVNGYLPIDRVVVRKFTSDNYVVLEGNRRICAARMIGEFDTDGGKIPDEVRDTLHTIPVLVYTGDNESNEAAWIFQGLRHITGNVDWSAFNKAKLLVEQMEEEGVSQTEVGRRFGLTGYGAGQWVRGFHAFRQARTETEYGAAIDERIYPYIQEIFGRSSIPVREWLEWDEGVKKFKNIANFNEFVGWFYSREESGEEATFTEPSPSDWDKRMIGKRDDIRQIGFLIQNSPSDFASFRQNGDVEAAYSRAQMARLEKQQVDRAEELFDAIEECTQAIENAPLSVMKDDAKKSKLADLLVKLQTAMQLIQ